MSDDCCSPPRWQTADCPVCATTCREVSLLTVLHHLNTPWRHHPAAAAHFYCGNRDCEVAYFDLEGTHYSRIVLRPETRTALANEMICFCYGIDAVTAQSEPEAKAFVIAQTRNKACACDTRNPSGRCCLKDFPE